MMKKVAVLIFLIILYKLILLVPIVSANNPVVIVLWHELQLADLHAFGDEGAMGLMNVRSGGTSVEASYLTLSSGSRAIGTIDAGNVLMIDERFSGYQAKDIYRRRTGVEPEGNIVHLDIAKLQNSTLQVNYPLSIGVLADELHNHNYTIEAFGNSDTIDQTARWAGLVAINSQGIVASGLIDDSILTRNELAPFGLKTNYNTLLTGVIDSDADVIIVDLGDPYRFSQYKANIVSDEQVAMKENIFAESHEFITQLKDNLPENATIMIVAPYPSENKASVGQWLAPVLIYGQEEGIVQSGTTRWPGIVANIDLAVTVFKLLGVENHSLLGRPMEIIEKANPLVYLTEMEQRLIFLNKYRGIVVRILVGLQIVGYLLVLGFLTIPKTKVNNNIVTFLQLLLLIILTMPLNLLLMPIGYYWPFAVIGLTIIGFFKSKKQVNIIMILTLITTLVISIDIMLGSSLMRFSFLGYDAFGGSRYYGIGNEFMGVLMGTSIIGWTALRQLWRSRFGMLVDLLFFLGVTILISLPSLGTNVGGAITAVIAFTVTFFGIHNIRWRFRNFIIIFLLVIVFLSGLMSLDSLNAIEKQSHIGQTVRFIRENGINAITMIIVRKLNMNIKLFRYSFWSRGLIVALIAMSGSLLWPSSYLRWLYAKYPLIVKGLIGTIAASVSGFLVNDSGVVAASTAIVFAANTSLYLALSLLSRSKHNFSAPKSNIKNNPNRN